MTSPPETRTAALRGRVMPYDARNLVLEVAKDDTTNEADR